MNRIPYLVGLSAAVLAAASCHIPSNIQTIGREFSSLEQQAYIKASNTGAGDAFGGFHGVALAGDTLVVGAYRESSIATGVNGGTQAELNNDAPDAGAVYVFVRDGRGNWSQQAYIKASNTDPGDWFGFSVALSADGNTLAVGAPHEASSETGTHGGRGGNEIDNSARDAGAVYVFTRDAGGNWSQQAYIKASNTDAGDLFGFSVALDGGTLVVGAIDEASDATGVDGGQFDNSDPGAGAVYVFVGSGDRWSQQAYIKASNTAPATNFGWGLALGGDTLAVGAIGESSSVQGIVPGIESRSDAGAPQSGAVYVFTRGGTTWSQQAYIKASNPDPGDWFGYSLAVSGDTLAVGAVREDSAATGVDADQQDNSTPDAGAVYAFTRDGNGIWSQQAYIKPLTVEAGDAFGASLGLSGDELAVGAGAVGNGIGIDGAQASLVGNAGTGYLFTRDGKGRWRQKASMTASNSEGGDGFGASLAISGHTIAIGAPSEDSAAIGVDGDQSDNSAPDSGAVYVFTH